MSSNFKLIIVAILTYFITFLIDSDISFIISFIIIWTLFAKYIFAKRGYLLYLFAYIYSLLFIYAESITLMTRHENATAFILASIGITILLSQLLAIKNRVFKNIFISIVFLFIILSSLIAIIPISYYYLFNVALSPEACSAIMQTSYKESYEFVRVFVSFKIYLSIFVYIILIFIVLYKQTKHSNFTISFRAILVALFLIYFAKDSIRSYNIVTFFPTQAKLYIDELAKFTKAQNARANSISTFKATKNNSNETYIIVIGESANSSHMSLNGYERVTTPNFDKLYKDNNLLNFSKAYANHVQTMKALSMSLTQANQINKKEYMSSPSIINIANSAGFETHWLSNQSLYGLNSTLLSVLATKANYVYDLNKNISSTVALNYDEKLIPILKDILNTKTEQNRIIFIHLMGSHYEYFRRYPDDRAIFRNPYIDIGTYRDSYLLNSYDDSIAYTDFVLNDMLKLLQKENKVSGFIYFSDHGEDTIKGHHPDMFTPDMAKVPFFIWLSKKYQQKYTKTYNGLKSNQNKLFSNDFIYDTLIGLTGIKTDYYSKEYDICKDDFILEDKNAYTLHGRRLWINK